MPDNTILIEQFIAGNHKAFETLVIEHRHKAQHFAQRYISDFHIAEDIVQEAFADCYMKRANYKHHHQFKTYLYTIIRNKCVDYLRKNNTYFVDALENQGTTLSTEDLVVLNEQYKDLYKAINNLNATYKHAIYLVDIEGFSYSEAAKVLGKNAATFKITLFRARQQLKLKILKEGTQ